MVHTLLVVFLNIRSKEKKDEEVKEFLKRIEKLTQSEREKLIYDLVWFDENILRPPNLDRVLLQYRERINIRKYFKISRTKALSQSEVIKLSAINL